MTTIALDGHMIGMHETGNETYIAQLGAALGRLGGYDYRLYTPHPQALAGVAGALEAAPGISIRTFPDVPSFARIPWLYPHLIRKDNVSLLHMTYIAPPRASCPVVLSVHDVSYRIFPEFFPPRVRLILGLLVGPSVRHAARVITLSECARRDIIHFYHVPPERVTVTPAAAGPQYTPQPQSEVARVCTTYNLPERYVLAVGNVQPRKNLPRLIEAFSAAAEEAETVLAIVGRSAWRGSEVEATVKRLGLQERVRFTGYVPDSDLPALYTGATLFCYPSLYEGFGLPPLEAMSCGTPTITSNISSLPEVVGDSALAVDPTSVAEIAAALRRLLTGDAARQEYRAKGLKRAALFSWERTAQLTRDVYDEVLGISR